MLGIDFSDLLVRMCVLFENKQTDQNKLSQHAGLECKH
jgi:hypothetical protein